ncbi:hypothetical protein BH18ACI2_BH18ACI2_27920 [soil metagenome]
MGDGAKEKSELFHPLSLLSPSPVLIPAPVKLLPYLAESGFVRWDR